MTVFFFLLLLITLLAQLTDFFLPPLDLMAKADIYNVHIYITPVVVFYAASALPFPLMLVIAFLAGFFLDLTTVQIIAGKVEIGVGWSILLYAVLAGIMHGLRPLFMRGRREVHWFMCGFCTSVILLSQYLMIAFRRGSLIFTREVWWQIGGPGLIAMLMAPLVFALLDALRRATGYRYSMTREVYL